MAASWVASPLKGEGEGEGFLRAMDGSLKTPHLSPLPLRKGRGETKPIELTIIERYPVAEAG
jgi:hypothetical protein